MKFFFVCSLKLRDGLPRAVVLREQESKTINYVELANSTRRSETGLLVRNDELNMKAVYNRVVTARAELPLFNYEERNIPAGLLLCKLPLCPKCKGSGGSMKQGCSWCDGNGINPDNIAYLNYTEHLLDQCPKCEGTGNWTYTSQGMTYVGDGPCARCAGKGKVGVCQDDLKAHMQFLEPKKGEACCDVVRNVRYGRYRQVL